MKLIDVMKNRRSVRDYIEGRIPREQLEQILLAGLLSPSGKNTRPWEFIVVEDREMLDKLAASRTSGANMLKKAACAIAVLGDEELTDTWIEDCSIAMSNMHLMADHLGLGSCWIQQRMRYAADGRSSETYVRELLHFPEHYRLEAILTLGTVASHPAPHTEEDAGTDKVHYGRF